MERFKDLVFVLSVVITPLGAAFLAFECQWVALSVFLLVMWKVIAKVSKE